MLRLYVKIFLSFKIFREGRNGCAATPALGLSPIQSSWCVRYGWSALLAAFRAADPSAVLDSPTVQRSRSFGFAETVSKHVAARVARLRMARRGGEMDR